MDGWNWWRASYLEKYCAAAAAAQDRRTSSYNSPPRNLYHTAAPAAMSFQAVVGGRRTMAPLLAATLAFSSVAPAMALPVSELTETTFDKVREQTVAEVGTRVKARTPQPGGQHTPVAHCDDRSTKSTHHRL